MPQPAERRCRDRRVLRRLQRLRPMRRRCARPHRNEERPGRHRLRSHRARESGRHGALPHGRDRVARGRPVRNPG